MHISRFVSLLALANLAASCVVVLLPSPHRKRSPGTGMAAKRQLTEHPVNPDNVTHWTVDQNTRQMQISDDAFIAHDLARFNHAPDSVMYYTGGIVMNLTEHIEDMRLTFSIYSNVAPHNHNYRVLFGEGDWTVAMAKVDGINDGPIPGLSGDILPPTGRPITFDLMTIARWNGGMMKEEYLWSDSPSIYRQFGVLPVPPAKDLPNIELNPFITPVSTTPGVDNSATNKAKMAESDDALNAGTLDDQSLHLSSNLTVYGLADTPLDLDGYLKELAMFKTAFPDLRLENKPYRQIIAQGDWTATIAMLSGTHKGPLTLPLYLASAPVQPTGKKFDLLHYTICRWQDGLIVDMRINIDTFGILGELGIPL